MPMMSVQQDGSVLIDAEVAALAEHIYDIVVNDDRVREFCIRKSEELEEPEHVQRMLFIQALAVGC